MDEGCANAHVSNKTKEPIMTSAAYKERFVENRAFTERRPVLGGAGNADCALGRGDPTLPIDPLPIDP